MFLGAIKSTNHLPLTALMIPIVTSIAVLYLHLFSFMVLFYYELIITYLGGAFMNSSQSTLVSLLSTAIRDERLGDLKLEKVNWREVFDEAKTHDVYSLIYPLIKSISKQHYSDEVLMSEWRNATLMCGIIQLKHINQMKKVFQSFKEANIPIIALKGLVLREMYPRPESRTMGDADVLVHKEDVEEAEKILISLGYIKFGSIPIHLSFEHKKHLSIDLHSSLVDELQIKSVADFEDTLWQNTRVITMNGLSVLSLSLEYELLHLILHIASHMIKSGFGLRQICDVVLFVEREKNNINWSLFFEKVKLYNIEKLVKSIFIVCKELFDMDLPYQSNTSYFSHNSYIELIIKEIFSSGVQGSKDHIRINSTKILHHSYKNNINSTNKIKLLTLFLFPPTEKLVERYSYAKRYPFLILFAWIHRFIYQLYLNGFSTLGQVRSVHSTLSITKGRIELLKWLQL
jgi:hypothetical protein